MTADDITSSFAPLRSLLSLISSSLDTLESSCKAINVPWPSLDKPVYVSQTGLSSNDALRLQSEAIGQASATIVAAAIQLVHTLNEPGVTAVINATAGTRSAAVLSAIELHIPDILRDAELDVWGLHVNEIAKKVQIDPAKLARILRFLATHHIFTERRPNVFANNRVSAILEKGQPIEVLLQNPKGKCDKPESAIAVAACHLADEVYKANTHMFEILVNPDTAFSGSATKCAAVFPKELVPSSTASTNDHGKDGITFWEIVAHLGPPSSRLGFVGEMLRRIGVAMESSGRTLPLEGVLAGFDFASLPPSSTVFDVGGGIGAATRVILKRNTHLKFVVQDRAEVCKEGVLRWKESDHNALQSGQVTFKAQSFLSPQSQDMIELKPAVYILKHVLHDWSDSYCHQILKYLRDAAAHSGEKPTLLVIDFIVSLACHINEDDPDNDDFKARQEIPGVYQPPASPQLLANWGYAAAFAYSTDLNVFSVLNGQERTLAHTRALLRGAGWEVVKVTQSKVIGQPLSLIEAKAI